MSLPVRERGLKRILLMSVSYVIMVAPRAGAWIETNNELGIIDKLLCRSPCGSVD